MLCVVEAGHVSRVIREASEASTVKGATYEGFYRW